MRLLLPILSALLSLTNSHHVIFVHNMGTKSHLIQMKPLMSELLDRGHTVSAIIFNSVKINHENFTEIVIPSAMDSVYAEASKKLMEKGGTNMMNPSLWWWAFHFYKSKMEDMSLDLVRSQEVQQLIQSGTKIDAVITLFPNNAMFAEIFDCPVILFSPIGPLSTLTKGTGNIINHSIQPYQISSFIEPMTFANRLTNHAIYTLSQLFMDWIADEMYNHQKEFLKNELSLEISHPELIIKDKFSVLLTCSHVVTHGAWQYLPNVIEVTIYFVSFSVPRLAEWHFRKLELFLQKCRSSWILPQKELFLFPLDLH